MISTRAARSAAQFQQEEKDALTKKQSLERASESRRLAKAWSQPLEDLKMILKAPAVGIDKWPDFSRTDKKQTNDAMNAVFEEWLTAAKNEGIELAEEAKFRLVMYCYAQSTFGFNFLDLESFWKAYRRLQELEAFAPATVTVIEKSAAPQKAVPETLEDLDGSTREGLKKMRRLTENATWGNDSDYAAVIDAWLASLVEFFDFRPTTAQKKLAIDWIIKMNLPLHSPKSFDSARRHLTKSGQWPQGMLLPAEQLDDTIENWRALHPGASDWEERTELRRLQKVFLGQV